MKRLLLCLVILLQAGCMGMDHFAYEDMYWHDFAVSDCGCASGTHVPVATSPRVMPVGSGVVPAGGIPTPPPPPQTREPELFGK